MDYQTALKEFADLLEVGAGALGKIAATGASSADIQPHLAELNDIALRLRQIGEQIAEIAT